MPSLLLLQVCIWGGGRRSPAAASCQAHPFPLPAEHPPYHRPHPCARHARSRILCGRQTQWPRDSCNLHTRTPSVTSLVEPLHVGGGVASRDSLSLPAQTAPPPCIPTPAHLAHPRPRKHRLSALLWGGTRHPSLKLFARPLHLRAPLTLQKRWKLWRGGASGNSPDPCARRWPVRPPAPTPPRAVPGGAAPWSWEAGAVCSRSCDPSQVGAVCRSHPTPRIMRRRPWFIGP